MGKLLIIQLLYAQSWERKPEIWVRRSLTVNLQTKAVELKLKSVAL